MTSFEWVLAVLIWMSFVAVLLPTLMFKSNLRSFTRAPRIKETSKPLAKVSLLIPARDEASGIEACLQAALTSDDVELEIVVLDDHSTDETAAIVQALTEQDARIRLEQASELPEGWCGKQYACWQLSKLATYDVLVFIDADVHLSKDALSRAVAFLGQQQADLVSGFPRQITKSLGEILTVSQIMFLLTAYLPIGRSRQSNQASMGAGCGQWFIARRRAYEEVGGHQAIQASLHDGVKLPRAFRAAGFTTDIFDGQDTASCRMYRGFGQAWQGFAKNATEGMAGPVGIWVWTWLLLFGHVLPWIWIVMFAMGMLEDLGRWTGLAVLVSLAFSLRINVLIGLQFRQGVWAVVLRPVGIIVMIAIQWYARVRHWLGKPVEWRRRAYGNAA